MMLVRLSLSALYLILFLMGCSAVPKTSVEPCQCAEIITPAPIKPLYQQVEWDQLPGWHDNTVQSGFLAWRNGCLALDKQIVWQRICTQAQALQLDEVTIRQFIENQFIPLHIRLADGKNTGLITGYYEPLLEGNTHQTAKARYPLYATPADLITVELGSLYPDLKNRRLRGRLVGNKLLPYYSRADIEQNTAKMPILAWANDAIELFFLQIQGSGRIKLPNGDIIRVGYADQNGHPYRSIGTWLIEQGELQASQASMQGIQAWARAHPSKLTTLLNTNPSFVFFRKLSAAAGGPLGALGIPLTEGYSIAIDRTFIPLGAPLYLVTQYPNTTQPLQRLVAAQDTGGAIRGPIRADFFWGFGSDAGKLAGKMKQQGSLWILWPKEAALPF